MLLFLIPLFFIAAVVSSCATTGDIAYGDATYVVFFGRDIGESGGEAGYYVSDQDWTEFERSVIAATLPGYTVLDGVGGYLPPAGSAIVDHENTKILMYVAISGADGSNGADDEDKIRAIAERYKELFNQESVLIIRNRSAVLPERR